MREQYLYRYFVTLFQSRLTLLFIFVALIGLGILGDASHSVADSGCVKNGDTTHIKFSKNCFGDVKNNEIFRFSANNVHKCKTEKKSFTDSETPELILFVGVKEISPERSINNDQQVSITITPPENEEAKKYVCGSANLQAYVDKLLKLKSAGLIPSAEFVKISDSFHAIKNISAEVSNYFLDDNGNLKRQRNAKKNSSEPRHNFYYKIDALGNIVTGISCYASSPTCSVIHSSIVNGSYSARSLFPSEYESRAFEISDDISKYLEKSYQLIK